jgi:hypothetical protein
MDLVSLGDPIQLMNEGRAVLYLDGLNEMGQLGPQRAGMIKEWLGSVEGPKSLL